MISTGVVMVLMVMVKMMMEMMMMATMKEIHTHESRSIHRNLATQVGHHPVRGAHRYRVT